MKYNNVANTSKSRWRETYTEGLKESQTISDSHNEERPQNQFVCKEYICFRREGDRKRHKCVSEEQKPVSEQRGAVQCPTCVRWFHICGGLAVHKCRNQDSEINLAFSPLGGSHVAVTQQLKGRKEGRCVYVCRPYVQDGIIYAF